MADPARILSLLLMVPQPEKRHILVWTKITQLLYACTTLKFMFLKK